MDIFKLKKHKTYENIYSSSGVHTYSYNTDAHVANSGINGMLVHLVIILGGHECFTLDGLVGWL